MSSTIQSKGIQHFAYAFQGDIVAPLWESIFCGLPTKVTTDVSPREWFSCNFQFVSNLEAHRLFGGF